MPDGRYSAKDPGSTLQASLEELRRRCQAVGGLPQGGPSYGEELAIFQRFAAESGFLLDRVPGEISRPPDDEGNEHQVWFEKATDSYLKATWPDFFGKRVIYAPDETANSSPVGYLDRWHLHNEVFGDAVEFLGAWQSELGLRLIIRQPAISGAPASEEQIRAFFDESGWRPFQSGLDLAYFDPARQIAVSDTHPGNIVVTSDGSLVPIDLRMEKLPPHLVDAVARLANSYLEPRP